MSPGLWLGILVIAVLAVFAISRIFLSQPGESYTTGGNGGPAEPSNTNIGSDVSRIDRASSNIVGVAESIEGASRFGALLSSTGVATQIRGAGPYTIFVPRDSAFAKLPSGTISGMTAAELKRFVQYQVVSGRAVDVDAQIAGAVTALSGDALNFNNANNIPMVGSAIIVAQYRASNGIVYLVDSVNLPPQR